VNGTNSTLLTRFGHRLSLSNSLCRQPREHAQNPAGEPCAEVLRSATRKGDLPSEPSTSLALAEQARYWITIPATLLRRALTRLSPEHHQVIDLVYYHEKSVDEVAQIIDVPPATVKTRMFYARKKLAELVDGAEKVRC
jgi:RNA polymerase sigma factor (sigma-70 family)